MSGVVSARRRREVLDALRRGTVPHNGLDLLGVGLDRFEAALDSELDSVRSGGAVFKAVRGEYGSGKTFFSRWLGERAKRLGMAVAEVQISETETPLHKLETVYRRVCESLETAEFPPSAFRPVLDAWLFALESESESVDALVEKRLAEVSRTTPAFASALRGYRNAQLSEDKATAEGLVAWLGGQPHVAASIRRSAGVRGDLDHFGAFGFLQGLLTVLRDSGHPGLLVILDEVETLQRVRTDVREKALNALRQLVDEIDSGRFPGLYLLTTGTPAFFDGTQGMQRLPPLAQRLATDFTTDTRFDNPRAVQIRLPGFSRELLKEVGSTVRNLYVDGATRASESASSWTTTTSRRSRRPLPDCWEDRSVAPRVFLKKLVGDVLDRVDQFDDFDPRRDYKLTVSLGELNDVERNAASGAASVDDIKL